MLDTLLRRREPLAHLHEQRTRYLARGGIPAPLARLLQTPLPPTTTPLQAHWTSWRWISRPQVWIPNRTIS